MMSRATAVLLPLLAFPLAPLRAQHPPPAPIQVSGDFMAGLLLTSEMPPSIKADVSGTVVLKALIGVDGHVKQLNVVTGPVMLQSSCIDAVQKWTYKPYLVDGKPVEVETFIEISEKWGVPFFEKPVRVSGGVLAGTILTKVMPIRPQEAIDAHVNGAVVMHVIIGKDGHVKDVSVISGPQMLRAAYADAVRQWTYKPYLLNGETVEVDTTITINIQYGGQ